MNARQKGSQGSSRNRTRKLVKNKIMIGDARLNAGVKPENRSTVPRVTRSSAASDNYLASQFPDKAKRLGRVDGTKFKREIGAKKQRATQVYGSRSKALAASFRRDKTTGAVLPAKEKKETPSTERGGLKAKKTTRPRNKSLI